MKAKLIKTVLLITIGILGFSSFVLPQTAQAATVNSLFRKYYTNNIYALTGYSGNNRYMTDLEICGNTDDSPNIQVCNRLAFGGGIEGAYSTWWWQLNKSITVKFNLIGYGWRSCTIPTMAYSSEPWTTVVYKGNGQCDVYRYWRNQ